MISKLINKNNILVSRTLILSVVAMGINYAIMFFLAPYITGRMGTDAYGFVNLAKTISNYGIIITSCLNTFASRFITLAYHEGDIKKANKFFSSVVISNIVLLVVVLFFTVFFIWKIQLFISVPEEYLHDVRILFFLDIVNYMILAIGNTFNVYAYIMNILDRIQLVRIISYLAEAIVLVALFGLFTPKMYYVGISLICSSIGLLILSYYLLKKYTPVMKIKKELFSWQAVKDLVVSGIWNSINNIGNLLNSGLDLWVSNLMLSATAMGELSVVKTVSTIFTTIAQLLCNPFHPQLLKKYSDKKISDVVKIFNKQIRLSGYVVCVIAAVFISIGKNYFILWTPTENSTLLYGICIITVLGFVFEGIAYPLFFTYTLTLNNRVPCVVTIISGFLNVAGMYILLKYTSVGLYGVVGTTSILGVGTYFLFTPLYAAHCLKVKWNSYYLSMVRVLLSVLVVGGIVWIIPFDKWINNWLSFIVCALCIAVISLPIYLIISVNKDEIIEIKRKIANK